MNVYDFDNTIYKGDSTADFYLFCLSRHISVVRYMPRLCAAFFKFYILKKGSKTEFKEKMYSFLKCADIKKDLPDFWKSHKKNIKKWYKDTQKEDDVIISASPRFLLEPICKELNIKHLIASEVNPESGKYTGLNCHGEEKTVRFKKIFGDKKIDKFFSDSKSDTPLAKMAEQSFIVKGDNISRWKF